MSGRRARSLPLLTAACGAALLLITSCGSDIGTPAARAGEAKPSASGGDGGRFEVKCYGAFTDFEGTPPTGHPTVCPERPASRPTPTVTMTPRFDRSRGWRGPTCTPRDSRGVTRHGSLVTCLPNGDEHEWVWPAGPSEDQPCVDAGEWVIRTPLRSMVCRDGAWVREPLKNPAPAPSDTSKPRLHPPAGRWHTGVPGS
ncbi:hypothetical protein DEJ48_32325 [Streptomyces venezuelae]|uniref:Lipoprotein n=1 Tax=Streptomyces venezuelae TaxID=54571 RepID=A0A5P2C3Y0_STRVZ|nr:hypothetical protein [Streptomyces venezuelae]QES37476.1 hypothetical protein DEJ48_32325 [Streptomyces venezuelae]